jgi:hypothetical protein
VFRRIDPNETRTTREALQRRGIDERLAGSNLGRVLAGPIIVASLPAHPID